jgi:hypothetical protein
LLGALWLPALAYALSSAFSGVPFASSLWGSALEQDTLGFMLIVAVLVHSAAAYHPTVRKEYISFIKVAGLVFFAVVFIEIGIIIIGQYAPNLISPAFSLIGSFEDLAIFLGLGVIGSRIALRFSDISPRARGVLSVAIVFALMLLAVANSSFVWILLGFASLGFFIETIMLRRPVGADSDLDSVELMDESALDTEVGNRPVVLSLVVLVASVFFFFGGTLGGAIANALHVNVLTVSPSWQSTLAVAQHTYGTSPIFGTWPGTFGVEWLKYRDASLNSTIFWNVDFSSGIGFIPTSFVTTGLLGALAWTAFLVLFIVFGLRMLIVRTPKEAFVRYVAILSFVSALYLLLAAIFRVPNAVILALAFVFVGLFASTMRFAMHGDQRGIIFARSPRVGFVIVFFLTLLLLGSVVVAFGLVERYVAVIQLADANRAYSAGNLERAKQAVQNAMSFSPARPRTKHKLR